jgi:hypothetical protein
MLYLITQRKSPNMKIRLVQHDPKSIRNPFEILDRRHGVSSYPELHCGRLLVFLFLFTCAQQ